jgi:hypothetical protein
MFALMPPHQHRPTHITFLQHRQLVPAASLGGDGGFLKVDGYVGAMKVHAGGSSFTVQIVEYQTT